MSIPKDPGEADSVRSRNGVASSAYYVIVNWTLAFVLGVTHRIPPSTESVVLCF